MELADQLLAYQKNVWPAMVADLAKQLGVSARSLVALGIGWMPLEACWVFPERNAGGKIVGLVRRFKDGKKFSIKGGKRGLTYALSPDFNPKGKTYVPGSHNWTRCSEDFPCPICGKHDWCLVSSDDPADPRAVVCGRIREGASQPLGESGYLHVRKPAGRLAASSTGCLATSDLPVLVLEGQSDVAAGNDLGFVAVGKPSASGGFSYLVDLLIGRDVVVIGEHDAGVGRLGMEKTFEALKPRVESVRKLMPPAGIKDLRAWLKNGLTKEKLLVVIEEASGASVENLLESTAPLDIADRWLQERHWGNNLPLLRMFTESWYRFDGTKYTKVDPKTFIRGDLYAFLKGKLGKRFSAKGDVVVEPYEANTRKVSDVIDAMTMTCPVYTDPPCWLDDGDHPCTQNTVTFSNGLLVLPDLIRIPATPRFFSLTAAPYAWSKHATCPRWLKFLSEVFPDDQEKIDLLQEWFGYNMVADTSQEKLMFFVGRPGAGKGTVLEAFRAVLGSDQIASTSFDSIVGDFGLQPLVGKLAAVLPDAHITRRGDPSKALQVLKEISGRDGVGINRKHKEFLSDHRLTCRFTISVNSMPDLPDHERSLDRRLLLLHFGESFSGREDTTLKDRLAQEAPGMAVWAMVGLLRLRSQGFTTPASSDPVIEEFRKQSSPVSEFADEFCEFGGHSIPTLMAYDAYCRWAKDQGIPPGSHIKFFNRFKMLNPGLRIERKTINGRQVRCVLGAKLTDEAVERYLDGRR